MVIRMEAVASTVTVSMVVVSEVPTDVVRRVLVRKTVVSSGVVLRRGVLRKAALRKAGHKKAGHKKGRVFITAVVLREAIRFGVSSLVGLRAGVFRKGVVHPRAEAVPTVVVLDKLPGRKSRKPPWCAAPVVVTMTGNLQALQPMSPTWGAGAVKAKSHGL